MVSSNSSGSHLPFLVQLATVTITKQKLHSAWKMAAFHNSQEYMPLGTFTLFPLSLFLLKSKKIAVCHYSNFLFLQTAVGALKIPHQASFYNTFIIFPCTVFLFFFPLPASS